MHEIRDLELLLRANHPIIAMETAEELRAVELVTRLGVTLATPVFRWTVTDGLRRVDIETPGQRFNADPRDVLGHIRASRQSGLYLLLDLHPYFDEPVHVRLLKDVALAHAARRQTLVLISHRLSIPAELRPFAVEFELSLPNDQGLADIVRDEASAWASENPGRRVRTNPEIFRELVRNLRGLSVAESRRLARRVIFDDGAITESDLPEVMRTKYELLNRQGVLAFEYDTADFGDVAGLRHMKRWLEQRRGAFVGTGAGGGLDAPKGMLLLGVQGSGKSLAARAVAGVWSVPLLRLDFGSLYNKFHGETERNLRESLSTAETMSPCVLWIDEIEKGIGTDAHDGGTSRRLLATLLTWLAENRKPVFLVATANDISGLPPELIRKGRVDEIFFVDLPDHQCRIDVFSIHLRKRDLDPSKFDLDRLAQATSGFSGAEIEQLVVSGLYSAAEEGLSDRILLDETRRTRPLSTVMAERIAQLREWAADRTVPAG